MARARASDAPDGTEEATLEVGTTVRSSEQRGEPSTLVARDLLDRLARLVERVAVAPAGRVEPSSGAVGVAHDPACLTVVWKIDAGEVQAIAEQPHGVVAAPPTARGAEVELFGRPRLAQVGLLTALCDVETQERRKTSRSRRSLEEANSHPDVVIGSISVSRFGCLRLYQSPDTSNPKRSGLWSF